MNSKPVIEINGNLLEGQNDKREKALRLAMHFFDLYNKRLDLPWIPTDDRIIELAERYYEYLVLAPTPNELKKRIKERTEQLEAS